MREIRMLRAMWRGLETGLRTTLHGHEGGNPGYGHKGSPTDHRASPRPYRARSSRREIQTRRIGRIVSVHTSDRSEWGRTSGT